MEEIAVFFIVDCVADVMCCTDLWTKL